MIYTAKLYGEETYCKTNIRYLFNNEMHVYVRVVACALYASVCVYTYACVCVGVCMRLRVCVCVRVRASTRVRVLWGGNLTVYTAHWMDHETT